LFSAEKAIEFVFYQLQIAMKFAVDKFREKLQRKNKDACAAMSF